MPVRSDSAAGSVWATLSIRRRSHARIEIDALKTRSVASITILIAFSNEAILEIYLRENVLIVPTRTRR